MISDRLLPLVRCPDCGGTLDDGPDALTCRTCGRRCVRGPGYLDLRPSTTFTEQTRYLDESLHADARHERVSPPLLQAGVRQWMLRRMLAPGPGDSVIDLGCGSGRSLVWNHPSGASIVGVDVAPYFAREALERGDLVLGDLRRLPFADGAFDKGYALDVFEHLSRQALAGVLAEIARVVRPGGTVFVYSHVRKNSWLAGGLKAVNRLARRLESVGLIDLRQERLRKSDHLNPLADIPDLEATVSRAGFRIATIRYYTPLIGAVVENILMRMAERALGRRAGRKEGGVSLRSEEDTAHRAAGGSTPHAEGDASLRPAEEQAAHEARLARAAAKRKLAARGPLYYLLEGITAVMTLDVRLFGRIRTGPYFVLLQREGSAADPDVGRGDAVG
jgi:SAM-dependent methyltransferase